MEELEESITVKERYDHPLMVGFNRRFSPLSGEIKKAFEHAGALQISLGIKPAFTLIFITNGSPACSNAFFISPLNGENRLLKPTISGWS